MQGLQQELQVSSNGPHNASHEWVWFHKRAPEIDLRKQDKWR